VFCAICSGRHSRIVFPCVGMMTRTAASPRTATSRDPPWQVLSAFVYARNVRFGLPHYAFSHRLPSGIIEKLVRSLLRLRDFGFASTTLLAVVDAVVSGDYHPDERVITAAAAEYTYTSHDSVVAARESTPNRRRRRKKVIIPS
jgi:hypothetical protein